MIKFKDYHWVLEGLAALLLLVAFTMMVIYSTDEIGKIVIQLTGVAVLFFTLMRIKPILSSRDNKDYVIVMLAEMIISFIIGILLLFSPDTVQKEDAFLSFSRLVGVVLFIRGVSHFWTTSKKYEFHDIISFIVHIFFISFGFLFLYSNSLKEKNIVITLIVISILLSIFFGYRSYKGYNNYRIQKENAMKSNNYIDKKKKNEKKEKIEDPKSIEEKINPKIIEDPKSDEKIDEPDDNRPSIDIN